MTIVVIINIIDVFIVNMTTICLSYYFLFYFRRANIVIMNVDNFRMSQNKEVLSFIQMVQRNGMLIQREPDPASPNHFTYEEYMPDWLKGMPLIPFPQKTRRGQ